MVSYKSGKLVKELRERADKSQSEVAKKAGISQNYLSGIETGAKLEPNMRIVKRLGELLGFTMDEWFEGKKV